ncbi:MAG TPA: ABC transporter ATP-binding protein [Candidatus Dojkabacteria bacterium]|nr:ABC transporter ATP-binding protein [Candidatus Dojkabacteria bacterium]HRO65125.1 ABC transporter ATP-binding protein [Candidatus Dojkabacteria bacterium]HRP51676.1 ABC transporter ATP-binding protein [Candidatus Dojkabacteria bacterium]
MPNILKIIKLSKPLHGVILSMSFLIVFGVFLDLLTPFVSKFIIDEIVLKIQGEVADTDKIILLIIFGFVLSLTKNALDAYSSRKGDHLAGELEKFLTNKFYYQILTLPQTYFDSELSGKIINQLGRGIKSIKNFFNTATNFIIPSILQSIFIIITLAYYSVPIALLTAGIFPIYLYLTSISARRWGKEEEKKNKIEDITRGRIQEVITNIKVVKSFTNELPESNFVSEKIKKINTIYAKQSKNYHLIDFARNSGVTFLMIAIYSIIFYMTFEGRFSIGVMVLIIQLLDQARRPLYAMSYILTQVQTAEAGSKEFIEILDLPQGEELKSKSSYKNVTNPQLTFENVSFHYKDSEDVLKTISAKLGPDEKVALVGHSGAGKSTLVNLILRFYEPQNGEMKLNGESYNELDQQFIRNNVALVFQENELFSTTIKENVAYGIKATDEEVIKALKQANAWDFVEKLPKKLNAEVGERGVKLSGGQKQRIQIARAILKNAPILILDEATSNLDSKSEEAVQDALEYLMKDKLVIIIAHRFSTIQNVDKIIVLHKGKIADMGTPGELARKDGVYSELLQYQIEGNKKLLKKYELY